MITSNSTYAEIEELRRIAKEEYDAIPEEEHQRRIAEQQQANRERYDRKMMRKGYKCGKGTNNLNYSSVQY